MTTWGLGEYSRMAERLEAAAELAVSRTDVARGDRVLDIACGTGNGALLAARRGAHVTGVDIEPLLIDQARRRAAATGADVRWLEADAAALPLPDAEFTVVLSLFGVMYVVDQHAAARELARVAAPGARLALAAWAPGSFMPAMGKALAPYLPAPPAGADPPSRCGDEERLHALLTAAGITLRGVKRESLELQFRDRRESVDFLIATAGHVLAERPRLIAEKRWDLLLADLEAVVDEYDSGLDRVSLTLAYGLASAERDQWRL